MRQAVTTWVRAAQDVFFPPSCVHCSGVPEGAAHRFLCESCVAQVRFAQEPVCETCGHPFYGAAGEGLACEHCALLEPVYRRGRTLALLRGPVRSLVHQIKYAGALHVLEEVARLARCVPSYLEFLRGAVLVPVPLHPRKERERGYNQARLLADVLAKEAGGATSVKMLLRREADTLTQTRLERRERQANLKNAFALADAGSITHELRIVLVDDVFTTGSTLNACAQTLRRAGFQSMDVATLAHG